MRNLVLAVLLFTCVFSALAWEAKPEGEKNFKNPGDPLFLNETFYSGFLTSNNDNFFYWLFESRRTPATDPLIIWLSGGPGCSSEISVFFENGPYRFNEAFPNQYLLQTNPYSWNNVANILYIDQPKGLGYSKTQQYDQNETVAVQDVVNLIKQFFTTFPAYKGRKLYIGGSSYTGHYVANIGAAIRGSSSDINLAGVLLGNAWVDPYNQYGSDALYAFQNGLITQARYLVIKTAFDACRVLINQGKISEALTACQGTLSQLVGNPPNFNYYNIKAPCNTSICYNFTNGDEFLKQTGSQLILGVTGRTWSQCNNTADGYFAKDRIVNSTDAIKDLLEKGVQVLVYNGDQDLISNWIGGEYWTTNVTWSGQDSFIKAPYTVWKNYGKYKSYKNFIFYTIYNAGHLASIEQPAATLDMLVKLLAGWTSTSEYTQIEA